MSFKQYVCRADRIKQLIVNLKMRGAHPELVARLTHKLIDEAFKSEKYGFAFDACMELGDKERLRFAADKLYDKCPTLALDAYRHLKDEKGVRKIIREAGKQNEPDLLAVGIESELSQRMKLIRDYLLNAEEFGLNLQFRGI